jgi:hypothetical protein
MTEELLVKTLLDARPRLVALDEPTYDIIQFGNG